MLLAVVFRSPASAQEKVSLVEGFPSSGKKIRVERFSTVHPGYHPAVFLTYGSSGLTARGDALRDYARRLAEHGYVVFLIHYFDATDSATAGTLPVSLPHFRVWTKALEDGIAYASKDPQVDRHRIGILGFSLGAFLALWESSQDPRVKAVVEYYGGTGLFLAAPKRMPATLILHGERTRSCRWPKPTSSSVGSKKQHAPYEIKIYPNQEHGFDGAEGDPPAAKEAWERTLNFFDKYLAGG